MAVVNIVTGLNIFGAIDTTFHINNIPWNTFTSDNCNVMLRKGY